MPRSSARCFEDLSNWGRWGAHDERGALNLLTPDLVAAAAGLVRDGASISLSLPLNTTPAVHNPMPADHHMTQAKTDDRAPTASRSTSSRTTSELDYHNDGHTHIDALCHVGYQGRLYNDRA